ncbi:hypothetical protein KBC03_07160 [Patescibacteria group bacterium]|nr:hypothetical protein [Patescibacteria group bacterium]
MNVNVTGFNVNRKIDLAKVSTVEQLYPGADKNPLMKRLAETVKAVILALPDEPKPTATEPAKQPEAITTPTLTVADTVKKTDTVITAPTDTVVTAPIAAPADTVVTPPVETTPEQPKAPEGFTNVEKANAPADLQAVYDYILKQWPEHVVIASKDGKYFACRSDGGAEESYRIYLSTEKVDPTEESHSFKLYEDGALYFGQHSK